jgi:hypothetical protein
MKTLALTALLLLPFAARADHGIGQWKGSGVVFDAAGKQKATFTVEIERKAIAPGVTEGTGAVRLSTGEVIPLQQKSTARDNGFALETPGGKGGGYCYGAGLCSSYEDRGNDNGRVTVIIMDGEDKMRLLITDLEGGSPVRYIRQSLTKVR